jgi:hypothetical protein
MVCGYGGCGNTMWLMAIALKALLSLGTHAASIEPTSIAMLIIDL